MELRWWIFVNVLKEINKRDVVLFTYNVPHRKTFDVMMALKARGYSNVLAYAVPMHYKKTFKPIYEHRPSIVFNIAPCDLAKNLDYDYCEGEGYDAFYTRIESPILVCGAGLIPEQVLHANNVINAHPGYIPEARGLDAFKWAIVENKPIGVTTHLLGDEVDAGQIIERCKIPVYSNDTFHAVAQRVYENEIRMLVDAIGKASDSHEYIGAGNSVLHKRMPADIEKDLMSSFEIYKEKYSVN